MEWIPIVEGGAVVLAAWAAWLSVPRAPVLDAHRLFKSAISVGLWAAEEAKDPQAEPQEVEARWRTKLAACVPFHPAGRDWRAKISRADLADVPVPALPGERALVEALAELNEPIERWDRLFGARGHATDSLLAEALGDPRELGAAYDPRRLFGPEGGWEAVATWGPAVQEGLRRRLEHVVALEVGLSPGLSLSSHIPDIRAHAAPGMASLSPEAALALMEAPSDRLVVVLHAQWLIPWLESMAQSPALVDRVVAVVVCGGAPARDDNQRQLLEQLLESPALLPELQRQTPIAVVDDIDPTSPLESGMPPVELPNDEPGRSGVRWVDLGPLPVDQLDGTVLGRALALTAAFLLDG